MLLPLFIRCATWKREGHFVMDLMKNHGANINEESRLVSGGKQLILMVGYQIPSDINNGLAYLHCHPLIAHEFRTLPYIIMTADLDLNPSVFDNDVDIIHNVTDDILISMGSVSAAPLPSTTPDVNHTSLMWLSFLIMTTWLMICWPYGNLTVFVRYMAPTSRQLPIKHQISTTMCIVWLGTVKNDLTPFL
jgi:hypothetical protein